MANNYQTVMITGSSSGFGLLTAVALAREGYHVYATMRNLGKQERLLTDCKAAGVTVEVRQLDVTKPETITPVIEEIKVKERGPDVLVNNAGFGFIGFFEDTSNRNFEEQLATNFYGALNCTRAVLPGMQERRRGLILNVSSIAGLCGAPTLSAYTTSKFAMEGWSESLRYELKPWGVAVAMIEPGVFKTDISTEEHVCKGDGLKNPAGRYYEVYPKLERRRFARFSKYAQDPQAVVHKIVKIVKCRQPHLRYIVGLDARMASTLKRLLPGPIFEWLNTKLVFRLGQYLKLLTF
jgi:short-subunit dehydrogenase